LKNVAVFIIVLLGMLTPVSIYAPHVYVFGKGAKNLEVLVNLNSVSDNIGTFEVHVTVNGKEILEQSKTIDSSNQTCPDDTESLCFIQTSPFIFPGESVPVGSMIQACVKDQISGNENCALGENGKDSQPETIWVGVPALSR
jgi:hypothetical protein